MKKQIGFVVTVLLLAMSLVWAPVALACTSVASFTVDCTAAYFSGTVADGEWLRLDEWLRLEVRLHAGPDWQDPVVQDDYIVVSAPGPLDVTVPWVTSPDGKLQRVAISVSTDGGLTWTTIAHAENQLVCPPPPDFEGCTPGGWQGGNLSDKWNELPDPDWNPAYGNPFRHGTAFNSFFTPWGSLDGLTMLDLVGTGGKADNARKAARSLVAAYLNASHDDVNYPKSTAELTAMWNAAVGSGAFLDLHLELDAYNNYGCSIQ